MPRQQSFWIRSTNFILGRPLELAEAEETKIGPLGGLPTLGLDGLSSAAYGPEAALAVLASLGVFGLHYALPIVGLICGLLLILYFSYRQTIAAYPGGGGSYTVAKSNLGEGAGLFAAAALMVDYVLNVAVGISAGVEALISAFPALAPHTLQLCLGILALITLVNLRGVSESSRLFGPATFGFIFTLIYVLGAGIFRSVTGGGHPHPLVAPPALPPAVGVAGLWLLLRSFAAGCTAMTGVEAVSNGVQAFRNPAVRNAQVCLTLIVVTLLLLLSGIAYLCGTFEIGAMDQNASNYQSVLSQIVGAVAGRGPFYFLTMGFVLAVLALSANTSFAGFPRLCRLVAQDDYMPHGFAHLGRRLVYSYGILILAGLSGALLAAFGGITDRLIPLFAVGAFLAFTLSQAGMVAHWKTEKQNDPAKHVGAHMAINGLGAICTAVALAVILLAKFMEGAWLTVLVIPSLYVLFLGVKRHYQHVREETRAKGIIDLSHLNEPVVLVPIDEWSSIAEKALRFAHRLSSTIEVVSVDTDEDRVTELRRDWEEKVIPGFKAAGLEPPKLVILDSPLRRIFAPLEEYIAKTKAEHPNCTIAVLIPELVEQHSYDYILHNHRAMTLKYALLFEGDPRLVVINVPWYLGHPKHGPVDSVSPERQVPERQVPERQRI